MAAIAEAKKNSWRMSVAVVNTSGDLVYFDRIDDAAGATTLVAQKKARTAVLYKRASKSFSEALAKGSTFFLSFPDIIASEGGVPIMADGKIIGAIGSSGGTGEQDGLVSMAGAALVK